MATLCNSTSCIKLKLIINGDRSQMYDSIMHVASNADVDIFDSAQLMYIIIITYNILMKEMSIAIWSKR